MMLKYRLLICLLLIFATACVPVMSDTADSQAAGAAEAADVAQGDADEHDHEGETEHREHGAHVHGAAALMIAWSGNEMAIDLETPAYNVLGFEYAPTSDEETTLLEESIAALEAGDLLLINPDAECTVMSADVQTTLSEEAHEHEEEHSDEAHAHEEEKSPVEHACKHLEEGPEVAVTATTAADTASTDAITGTHIRLDVTLAEAEGYILYTAEEAGEYVFYTDSAITLTLQDADGTMIQPESTAEADALADCPGFLMAFTFDLATGENILAITTTDAGTESSLVHLVVEAVGGEHEHGEEAGGHDETAHTEESHSEEVHSDIDVAYNLTCQQPENIAMLDASALFAQFPNFEEIEVQWVSDTQQSASDLTPDNPVISFE